MWSAGYLEQARSDWAAYRVVESSDLLADCHALHYLQMATEKLAKAFLLASGDRLEKVKSNHRAFTRFLQMVARNNGLQRELRLNGRQLAAHVRQLLPISQGVERLAPALAQDGPNAEYPWESPKGKVNVPAMTTFKVAAQLKSPNGRILLKIVDIVLRKHYVLFE